MSDLISLNIDDGIAILRLNRPEKRNALNEAMWQGLKDKTEEARASDPRALIITGDGGHFCAGMDLGPDNPLFERVGPAIAAQDKDAALEVIRWLKGCLDVVASFPAPTIAAIEGACVGGGAELALHCDIRIAARDARVGLPEVRVGMIPDLGGTVRLTRLVGTGRAARLILSGEVIDGEAAYRLGIVDKLSDQGKTVTNALAMVHEIAKGGPVACANALEVIRTTPDLSLSEAIAMETEHGARALTSGEPMVGVQAFLTKQDPEWS